MWNSWNLYTHESEIKHIETQVNNQSKEIHVRYEEKKKIYTMYNKILGKLANAGTVAMLGYEIGSHVEQNQEEHVPTTTKSDNSDIMILVIVFLLLIIAALVIKMLIKKRAIVWNRENRKGTPKVYKCNSKVHKKRRHAEIWKIQNKKTKIPKTKPTRDHMTKTQTVQKWNGEKMQNAKFEFRGK